MRYDNKLRLEAHFYGLMTAAEQATARKLVLANAINMNDGPPDCQAYFHDGVQALKGGVSL